MRVSEKLYKHMLSKGLNQQRLARLASISDSEVSRILNGKSSPSLEYAFRLAKALGVSLDYLADDTMDDDPAAGVAVGSDQERELLELARELRVRSARRLLETAHELGYDLAMRRLLGLEIKPVIEPAEVSHARGAGRASSA